MSAERGSSVMTRGGTGTISRGGESSGRSVSLSSRISSPRTTSSKAGIGGLAEFRPSAPNYDRQAKSFSFQNSRPFTAEPVSGPTKFPTFTGRQLERSSFQEESKPAIKVSPQKVTGENIARSIISQKNIRTSKTENLTNIDRKIKTRPFSTIRDGLLIPDQNPLSVEKVKREIPYSINLGYKDTTIYRRPTERPRTFAEKPPKDLNNPQKKILLDVVGNNETKKKDLDKRIQKLVRVGGLEKTQQILKSQGEQVSLSTIFKIAINDQAKAQREEFKQKTLTSEVRATINPESFVIFQNNTRIFEGAKSEEAKANRTVLQRQRERIIFIAEKKEIKSKPIICFIEDFGRINVKGLQEGEIKDQKIAGKYISVDKSDKKAEEFAIGTLNSVDNHKISLKEVGKKHAEVCKECLGLFKQSQLRLTMSQGLAQ